MRPTKLILLVGFVLVSGCGREDKVTRGATLYAQNCMICHGADKRGGGGVSVVGLSDIPSDLTVLSAPSGVFPRKRVADTLQKYADGSHGERRMRPFTDLLSDRTTTLRTTEGRIKIPRAQAALIAYLEASQ